MILGAIRIYMDVNSRCGFIEIYIKLLLNTLI